MQIGRRSLSALLSRFTEPETYSAIARLPHLYRHPWQVLYREVFVKSGYPTAIDIKTPIGPQTVHLFSPFDLSTLNSVFSRLDYGDPRPLRTVVDFGANIGITGLYWLTRNPESRVYLYEPVPRNLERLRTNLRGFEDRYVVEDAAISTQDGTVTFGVEDTGRMGGIGTEWQEHITVRCVDAVQVLRSALERHQVIDCLKVDIEGHEVAVFQAIPPEIWARIRYVGVEDHLELTRPHIPDYFTATKKIAVMRYTNTRLQQPA